MRIIVRIKTELEHFRPHLASFLSDLSSTVNTPEAEIQLLGVRPGCSLLTIELPTDAAQILLHSQDIPEEVRLFLEKWQIQAIKIDGREGWPSMSVVRLNDASAEHTLTWLHISDLHMRSGTSAKQFEQNIVLKALKRDIAALLSNYVPAIIPDFVLFTGDIAFSGQKEEYAVARTEIEAINARLPRKASWYFVPGNHDVNWNRIDSSVETRLRQELSASEKVLAHLLEKSRENDLAMGMGRLENFLKFSEDCAPLGQPSMNHQYYFTTKVQFNSLSIGFAGLNSAWRSTKKGTKGNDLDQNFLILGEPQLRTVAEDLESSDLKIALIHHPPATLWFKDFDASIHSPRLSSFDFVLRGHEHRWKVLETRDLGGSHEGLEVAAGATFEALDRPISFNAVRLDLKTRTAKLFLWSYWPEMDRWLPDAAHARPNGFLSFNVP